MHLFLLDLFETAIKFNDIYLGILFYLGVIVLFVTLISYCYLKSKYKRLRIFLSELDDDDIHTRIYNTNEYFDRDQNRKWLPKVLQRAWDQFYYEYNKNTDEAIPDPLYYFNNNDMVNKAGYRKLVEILPAVFVSLGILGTFVGIALGISDIDTSSNLTGLQTGINTLLGGMKLAFFSSILGIIISVVYQLIDRIVFYQMLNKESDRLLSVIDKVIPIETESRLLDKVVKVQESQLNDMKTFFSDQFLPVLTSGISESVSNSMTPHLEKSNEIMSQVAENTLEAQSDSLNTMVDHFVESLNEVTGNQMKELGVALHKTIEWQEKVHNEMGSLVDELSNVAREQSEMARNTTELSVQMNEYTEKLSNYQDRLSNTTQDLESITKENTQLLDQMGKTYE